MATEMPRVQIRYSCGCGWRVEDDVEAAVAHSAKEGHTLTVLGVIRSPDSKK